MLRSGIQSSVQALFFAFVAQLAERQLYTLEALGSIPDESFFEICEEEAAGSTPALGFFFFFCSCTA